MRRATLSRPPVFDLAARAGPMVTLASDTGAAARIFVMEEDIVRLWLLPDGVGASLPSWAIAPGREDIAEPGRDRLATEGFACPPFDLGQADGRLTLATAKLRLTIRLDGFLCRWEQREGVGGAWTLMAEDRPTQAYDFGWWDGRVRHYLVRAPNDRFFGLGEKSGPMDRAGRRLRLCNIDAMGYDPERGDPLYKHIPFVLTADGQGRCHGAFYDNTTDMVFDFGQERDNYHGQYRSMQAEGGDLDLWMIAGPDPASVTRRFTWLTGRPALMPRWSLGYSGSTMSYTDQPDAQAQMARFIEALERHDIGCSSFHLSSGYTSIGAKRYVFTWNRDKFPDPAAFVRSYLDAGIRLVANIKPALLVDHPRFAEAAAQGLFVKDEAGAPIELQYWDEIGAALDFTNPATAAWWREQVTSALLRFGIAATWNDNNECEVWDPAARLDGFGAAAPAAAARPLQPLLMARASRQAQIAHAPSTRPYVVTRAGMAGMQRYAQTWTGDNLTAWASLKFNLRTGLGLALSGVSNAGHDVGGFAGARPEPELFLRWVQAGVLMPRFSIHSWNDDGTVNEPWMYPALIPAVRRLMALRQRLIPFFHDLGWRYHDAYEPIIQPPWLAFPGDPRAWADGEEHLLGRDVLACPVVEPGAETRDVYLPAGATWIHAWTGAPYAGGQTAPIAAPLDGPPPLFVREGSGLLIDFATQGFRPGPLRAGVWLFPPPGDGDFAWSAHVPPDDAVVADEPPAWHVEGRAAGDALALVVRWSGEPGARLAIRLPAMERRAIDIVGPADLDRSPVFDPT
jgi:alpha-glucosidase